MKCYRWGTNTRAVAENHRCVSSMLHYPVWSISAWSVSAFLLLAALKRTSSDSIYDMDRLATCGQDISVFDEDIVLHGRSVAAPANPPLECTVYVSSAYSVASNRYRLQIIIEAVDIQDCQVHVDVFDSRGVSGGYLRSLGCNSQSTDTLYTTNSEATVRFTRPSILYQTAYAFTFRIRTFFEPTTVSPYACENPYMNNGRPINEPADTDRTQCCKANKYIDRTTTSHFSCENQGGCCGETDYQYCCDIDKVAVTIGLSCAAGGIVLLGLIALLLYCVVRREYSSMGQEIYCAGCCRCKVRNKDRRANEFSLYTHPSENISSLNDTYTSHHASRPSRPYPEPDSFVTTVTPSAPPVPTPPPEREASDAPPSYDDVVKNPSGFPKTSQSDPQVYV